jgi:23S rRNA pseudouridine2605 synthase
LDKTYHVRVAANGDEGLLKSLTNGIKTEDGDFLKAKSARVVRHGDRNAWIEIVLDEGKNRHIRRMFEVLGIEVLRLVRIAIGPLQLGDLAKGSSRPLSEQEKSALDQAMAIKVAAFRERS